MSEMLRGAEMIVAGDFNVDLEGTDIQGRDEEIVAPIATACLEYLLGHFLPRQRVWCKDWRTRTMVRHGRVVWSRMNYILVSDQQIF